MVAMAAHHINKHKTMETAEDFFNEWASKNIEVKGGRPRPDELLPSHIFRCMEEYAERVKVKAMRLPTDTEIEKQIEECGLSKVPEGQQYWEGAIWMRSKLKTK